ncbi:MAG: ABC transporter ATP-binding protein [Vulcanimicrobiaceae bacterium]
MIPQAVIELEKVGKHYGSVEAVAGVSFSVERGAIVALLGPTGCGKTTILRMIAGLIEPSEGVVKIGGRDMRGVRPYERSVGLVFQDYALFPHMTVAQNVGYGLKQRGHSGEELSRRVWEMLMLVRLERLAERHPSELSGGQQQRVALARALAIEPQVVLLDEPLSALDAKLRDELRIELKEILKKVGSTTIVVTHDQDEAMGLADRIIVMGSGHILQEGTPWQIYRHPANREVASFVGRSNWMAGSLGAKIDGTRRDFVVGENRIVVEAEEAVEAGDYDLCVRPERVFVSRGDDAAAANNVFDCKVIDATLLGASVHLTVSTRFGVNLLLTEPNRDQEIPAIGSPITVSFRPSDGILLRRPPR